MMKLTRLMLAAALFGSLSALAQEKENQFTIDAQIRTRGEYRNGVLNPRSEGDLPAWFINDRARLSLGYKRDNLQMKLSAQHVGVWGQDPQIDKNGRFILHEAWARMDFSHGLFAQLGRQPLSYDDERLLGGLDWNVAGRFHDALKLGYESNLHKLHVILAFNQNDEKTIGGTYYAPGAQPYKTMQTVWYNGRWAKDFTASLLFMNTGFETGKEAKGKTTYMQTTGAYLVYTPGAWTLNGSAYYQSGKRKLLKDEPSQTVSAYMFSLKAGYKIDPKWSVSVGTDYLSGDPTSDKITTFDPLYGTHHKFYGGMDYFYASAYNKGLWDKIVSVDFKPASKWALSLSYHHFSTTYDVMAKDGKEGRSLGSELDFQIDYVLMKDVRLQAGYSTMLGTKYMDVVKGGSHKAWQDWGWLSLNINPRILFTKW